MPVVQMLSHLTLHDIPNVTTLLLFAFFLGMSALALAGRGARSSDED